jgi:hypothetical protein
MLMMIDNDDVNDDDGNNETDSNSKVKAEITILMCFQLNKFPSVRKLIFQQTV